MISWSLFLSIHGIMGGPEPNWISQVRPPPDCKYTHSTTPRLCVIGCRVAVPCSHWSAVPTPLLIYISQLLRDSFSVSQQPPSGNLLPNIPCPQLCLGCCCAISRHQHFFSVLPARTARRPGDQNTSNLSDSIFASLNSAKLSVTLRGTGPEL